MSCWFWAESAALLLFLSAFPGWNAWKDSNRQGMDCTVRIRREGSRIVMETENMGIAIESITTIMDDVSNIYVGLTGDQCALTNIHIQQGKLGS